MNIYMITKFRGLCVRGWRIARKFSEKMRGQKRRVNGGK